MKGNQCLLRTSIGLNHVTAEPEVNRLLRLKQKQIYGKTFNATP